MSDDSSQLGSNRGRRVLRAVGRRIKRVEIETHLIRADLAQFEAVQETGLAETLRLELDLDAPPPSVDAADLPELPSQAQQSATVPAPSKVVHVDLLSKRQQTTKRGPSVADFSAIPTRIDTELVSKKTGIACWVSPAWLLSVAVHFVMLLICGSLTYAILIDSTKPVWTHSIAKI